ncbi:hypothetical protein [Micromonospora deserti]|nr:hypothetical protein [Micromonospora deserti]
MFSGIPGLASDEEFYDSMRQGREGRKLNNDGYRLHLPEPGSNPFQNLGKRGYEAEARELMRLAEESDRREGQ